MTRDEARLKVLGALAHGAPPGDSLEVLDDATIEKAYGWVFFYQSKKFLETREASYQLAGNGPAVVLRDGTLHWLTSAYSLEQELARFEAEHGLKP